VVHSQRNAFLHLIALCRFLNQKQPFIECKLLSFEFPNNQAPNGIRHRENPENLGGEFPNEGFTAAATLGISFPDKDQARSLGQFSGQSQFNL
jgi:hypothetical protein